jgi:hypothetical protein
MSLEAEGCCSRADCSERVVASLGNEEFCLDHFCSRCYELLERSELTAELPWHSERCRAELNTLDECARRAVDISLGRVPLNNLDRARLLDILLWAGDLTNLLQHQRTLAARFSDAANLGRSLPDKNGSGRNRGAVAHY